MPAGILGYFALLLPTAPPLAEVISPPMSTSGARYRQRAGRLFWLALVFFAAWHSPARGQYLRVVTYNIEADIDGVTTPRDGLYTVLEAIGQQRSGNVQQPIDVLALQETTSNAVTVAPIVTALNAYYGAGVYAAATYQGTQRGGTTFGNGPNAMVYNTKTVSLLQGVGVSGTPSASGGAYRQVTRYLFQPVGSPAATAFYVYVSHMKSSASGTTEAVQAARNAEAQLITADVSRLPVGSNVLSMGDFNLDGSFEGAYQSMTTNGPFIDPLNVNPQNNNVNFSLSAYRAIMTDSSTSLRYRDDIQFMTANVFNGTAATGLRYVPASSRAFGNNGTTAVGKSTNLSTNTSLNTNFSGPISASAALSALTTGSDHLPEVTDYLIVTPYTTWKMQYFSANEVRVPAISGDSADPDGDSIPNLMEYALGTDARNPGVSGLPTAGQVVVSGQSYQTLTYTKVVANTDITYVPQVSSDLIIWNSGPNYLGAVSAVTSADGLTQTITVRDLTPAGSVVAGGRFIRLQVVR